VSSQSGAGWLARETIKGEMRVSRIRSQTGNAAECWTRSGRARGSVRDLTIVELDTASHLAASSPDGWLSDAITMARQLKRHGIGCGVRRRLSWRREFAELVGLLAQRL